MTALSDSVQQGNKYVKLLYTKKKKKNLPYLKKSKEKVEQQGDVFSGINIICHTWTCLEGSDVIFLALFFKFNTAV